MVEESKDIEVKGEVGVEVKKRRGLGRPARRYGKFTLKQKKAIIFMGDPLCDMTQQEIARRIGVGEQTICIWKRKQDFMDAVNKRLDSRRKYIRAAIYKASVKKALDIDEGFQDRKMLMQITGDHVSRSNINLDHNINVNVNIEKPREVIENDLGDNE